MFYVKEKTDEIEVKVELNSENVFCTCPDCGKKIEVFGRSHLGRVAAEMHLPVLAYLPIDPKVAQAVDLGLAETLDPTALEPACIVLETMLK